MTGTQSDKPEGAATGEHGKPEDHALGQTLRRLRQEAGITLQEAAKALGVSYQQVQKYEKGISRLAATSVPVLARLYKKPCSSFFEAGRGLPPISDPLTNKTCYRLASLEDLVLKRKIARIVAILAS